MEISTPAPTATDATTIEGAAIAPRTSDVVDADAVVAAYHRNFDLTFDMWADPTPDYGFNSVAASPWLEQVTIDQEERRQASRVTRWREDSSTVHLVLSVRSADPTEPDPETALVESCLINDVIDLWTDTADIVEHGHQVRLLEVTMVRASDASDWLTSDIRLVTQHEIFPDAEATEAEGSDRCFP